MIYILTVYDSLNYGSYFQAYALKEILKKYDDTAFLDIKHQSTIKQTLKKAAGHIYHGRFPGVLFEFKRYSIFNKLKKQLPIVKLPEAKYGSIYVFGSDEIWNINREKFLNSPEFFGVGLKRGGKIAYAPSVNTVKAKDFSAHMELIDGIRSFDSIAVRDEYSRSVLKQFVDDPIDVVTDPTILYGIENFRKLQADVCETEDFAVIYTYGKMCRTKSQIDSIKKAVSKMGLKLISVGRYLKWCDKSVMVSPAEFLGYIDKAKLVITDTFHGTVFSVLYRKNLVVVNPAQKIKDMLSDFSLNEIVAEQTENIDHIIDKTTDYSNAETAQLEKVKSSRDYLERSLAKLMGK